MQLHDECGLFQLADRGAVNRLQLAQMAAEAALFCTVQRARHLVPPLEDGPERYLNVLRTAT